MINIWCEAPRGRTIDSICVILPATSLFRFHDKSLKMLLVEAAYEQPSKVDYQMEQVPRINSEALAWLWAISMDKWPLSHDDKRRYGLMTTNFSKVFNSVLKGARLLRS